MKLNRNARMDNLRGLLILLVVFGHLLELIPGTFPQFLYKVIYSFHMPAFFFLSGYFARFSLRKLLELVLPYVLFQTLYRLFDGFVLNPGSFTLRFTTPYWILWYLVTLSCYFLLLPLLGRRRSWRRFLLLPLSVALCLAAGYTKAGYYLSISRTLVFLPFFLAGHYAPQPLKDPPFWLTVASGVWVVLAALLVQGFRKEIFYGSYSYASLDYGPLTRLLLLVTAAAWLVLLCWLPERKLPLLTAVGQRTLSIFLLHGFPLRLLRKWKFFQFSPAVNLLLALGITAAMAYLSLLLPPGGLTGKLMKKLFPPKPSKST